MLDLQTRQNQVCQQIKRLLFSMRHLQNQNMTIGKRIQEAYISDKYSILIIIKISKMHRRRRI